jgi:hypothetical protein
MKETWQRHNPDGNPDGDGNTKGGRRKKNTTAPPALRLRLRLRPLRRTGMAVSCYGSFAGVGHPPNCRPSLRHGSHRDFTQSSQPSLDG